MLQMRYSATNQKTETSFYFYVAKIMTLESGKPVRESIGEVGYGTSFIDYYAAEAIRSNSAGGGYMCPSPFSAVDGSPRFVVTIILLFLKLISETSSLMQHYDHPYRGKVMAVQEPVGVTALITPWNFPIAMITRKVAPALAAGCTVVLKPSELTPLTAIAVKQLANRAGIPDEVFQLV